MVHRVQRVQVCFSEFFLARRLNFGKIEKASLLHLSILLLNVTLLCTMFSEDWSHYSDDPARWTGGFFVFRDVNELRCVTCVRSPQMVGSQDCPKVLLQSVTKVFLKGLFWRPPSNRASNTTFITHIPCFEVCRISEKHLLKQTKHLQKQ